MKPLPPSRYTPSGRVAAPPPETMPADARAMYDRSLELFGGPGGPRMPLLHLPDVATAWGALNHAIMAAPLAARHRELAIVVVGAFWRAEMEWLMHAPEAAACGVPADAISAIQLGREPRFADAGDAIVHRYVSELQTDRRVSSATYNAARGLLGDAGLVALTVTIGHFTNVAMTLRAHELQIPDGMPRAFDATAGVSAPSS